MFGQSNQNTNKPICQFYQRGNCKHGNNCWNLHPGGSNGIGTSSNVFGGNSSSSFSSFGNNNANLQIQDKEFLEFVKQVGTEMTVWEEKGLWLLSCLAPLRDHPLLVGFTDTSPEELRVEAYEALKTNSSASYQGNYNQKLEFHKQLRQALKSKLPEAIEALKAVFYKSGAPSNPAPTSSATKSLFGKPASSSFLGAAASSSATPTLFGGSNSSNQTASVFGAAPNLGSGGAGIFGAKPQAPAFGAGPVFGGGGATSAFGGGAFKSSFGGTQSTGMFGGNAPSQNLSSQGGVFGAGTQQGTSSSIFGAAVSTSTPSSTQSSFFGSAAQNSSAPSLFGTPTPQQGGQQVFGAQSPFGTVQQQQQQPPPTGFGASNPPAAGTSSLFGNSIPQSQGTAQTSLFGAQPQAANSTGIFGKAPPTQGNLFGGNQNQVSASSGGVFGSTFGANKDSIFGASTNNVANNAGTNSSVFGNQQPPANSNIFGMGMPTEQEKSNSDMSEEQSSNPGLLNPQISSSGGWFASATPTTQPSSSIFGAPPSGANPSGANQSIFGAPPTTQMGKTDSHSNAPAVSASVNEVYTPIHLLCLEDKAEFERDHFLRIPLVPPPRQLCV